MHRYVSRLAAALWLGSTLAGCASLATFDGSSSEAIFENFKYAGRFDQRVTAASDEYVNPILPGYYPDPSIARVGDDYYLVNSSFTNFPGVPVFHSKDLVAWTQVGNAIARPTQVDFSGLRSSQGIYAPDISYSAGRFYIVTTCVMCKGNFVITASSAAGPWSDPVWLPFEGIDPSIFWDGDGKAYILNNGAPNEPPRYDGHRAIWIQEFDYRNLKMVGERRQIVNGGVDLAAKPIWIEGPHILKKDGWYYLTAAEGGTSVNHSQVVFRATTLLGPFLPYAGNPILTQRTLDPARPHPITSAGHAELVQTPAGDWWATFLATRPYEGNLYNTGRETFLLPVTWRNGWPVILENGKPIPTVSKRPALAAGENGSRPSTGDIAYVDEFDGEHLDAAWIGFRTPVQPFYTLSNGKLHMRSASPFGNLKGYPAFIGRRLQHHDATITTTLSFTPRRDGDRAGLMAVQSDVSNLFFGVTRIKGKTVVALYTRNKTDDETLIASLPVEEKLKLTLTIRSTGKTMSFLVNDGGADREVKAGLDASLLSTQVAGGFIGTVVGPYTYSASAQ